MLYKIENNNLIYIETNGKTKEQLAGWKELKENNEGSPNLYQRVESSLTEDENYIYQNYILKEKTQEEIIEINEQFCSENYYLIPMANLYVPHTTKTPDGTVYNLLQDDLSIMLMGASVGQLTFLDLYQKPDMTKKLSQEYLTTLKVKVDDVNLMTAVLGYMSSLLYSTRNIPSID